MAVATTSMRLAASPCPMACAPSTRPVGTLEDQLDMQRPRVRHQRDLVLRDDVRVVVAQPLALALRGGQPGAGRVPFEHLDAVGSDVSGVAHGAAADVVGDLPRLLLRGSGELEHHRAMGQRVRDLDGVADRVDVRVVRPGRRRRSGSPRARFTSSPASAASAVSRPDADGP